MNSNLNGPHLYAVIYLFLWDQKDMAPLGKASRCSCEKLVSHSPINCCANRNIFWGSGASVLVVVTRVLDPHVLNDLDINWATIAWFRR